MKFCSYYNAPCKNLLATRVTHTYNVDKTCMDSMSMNSVWEVLLFFRFPSNYMVRILFRLFQKGTSSFGSVPYIINFPQGPNVLCPFSDDTKETFKQNEF